MHRNAPLTPEGRLRLCERIEGGWPVAQRRGVDGDLEGPGLRLVAPLPGRRRRWSRGPVLSPAALPPPDRASVERRIVGLRQSRGLGPARIAGIVGMHASTVHRVLLRHGLSRLSDLDRVTREPIRRYEMTRPGELVHIDIKKLGRIPRGGGWRAHGRGKVKDHKSDQGGLRLRPYVPSTATPAWPTPRCSETSREPLRRPSGAGRDSSSPTNGIKVDRVLTDNGGCYRSSDFAIALAAGQAQLHPSLSTADQWESRAVQSDPAGGVGLRPDLDLRGATNRRLAHWLHIYNHHRHHTAIGGPPMSRVRNLSGHYI